MQVEAPFIHWGIDFIREIVDRSSGCHKWILVVANYFTKWIEVVPKKKATSKVVINFLMENIITRFGVPARLIINNGMCFISHDFKRFYMRTI